MEEATWCIARLRLPELACFVGRFLQRHALGVGGQVLQRCVHLGIRPCSWLVVVALAYRQDVLLDLSAMDALG